MAQYYQIVGQEQPIHTVTIDDLRQYYPNITCVESSSGVQYLINGTVDDTANQFQSQQVVLTNDHLIINSTDTRQQIIVDQQQISYQQPHQQHTQPTYVVQDETSQLYYAASKQQNVILTPQIGQQQIRVEYTVQQPQQQQIVINQPEKVQQCVPTENHLVAVKQLNIKQEKSTITIAQQQQSMFNRRMNFQKRSGRSTDSGVAEGATRLSTSNKNSSFVGKPKSYQSPEITIPQRLQNGHSTMRMSPGFTNQKNISSPQQLAQSHLQQNIHLQIDTPPSQMFQQEVELLEHPAQGLHLTKTSTSTSPPTMHHSAYIEEGPSATMTTDELKDSARVLVCLENGEQRLITFTLPRETCTVQDLLEQVGVPFRDDTKIECISNPGSDIEYIVYVGAVPNPYQFDTHQKFFTGNNQILTEDSLCETQTSPPPSASSAVPSSATTSSLTSATVIATAATSLPPLLSPIVTSTTTMPATPITPLLISSNNTQSVQNSSLQQSPSLIEPIPTETQKPPVHVPRFESGFLAVCTHCGYLSEDFNRCQRCRTKLPSNVKRRESKADKIKTHEANDGNGSGIIKGTNLLLQINNSTFSITKAENKSKSPTTSRTKKSKVQDFEPVILTLSSDDENETEQNTSTQEELHSLQRSSILFPTIDKEPKIVDDSNIDLEQELVDGIISYDLLKKMELLRKFIEGEGLKKYI